MKNINYENPIIKGYNPDPSICAVGEDFYIVTSSFEYFPGVPIYHSTNLVDWELINYCLTEPSQLKLDRCRCSGGIFAPDISYNNGTFYMITTNISHKGNFIVKTNDIRGKWSDPIWIDHMGIDPSLLFDDDGKVYYAGTGYDENGKHGIYLFEINLDTGEILSDKKCISYGAGGKFPEAPHVYKINGNYYLMMAEGGTEYGHSETIFRSKSVWGPYEACPSNPILSNRDDMNNKIQCTGHADLVQDKNNNWWMVCLAIRVLPTVLLHNLGRETFLAPVTWGDDEWPYVGVNGNITAIMTGPLPKGEKISPPIIDFTDDFNCETLNNEWNTIRKADLGRFSTGNGMLSFTGTGDSLSDFEPAFIGIRQKEFDMQVDVTVSLNQLVDGGKQGITVYYSKENHYDLFIQKEQDVLYAMVNRKIIDLEAITAKIRLDRVDGDIELRVTTDSNFYQLSVKVDDSWVMLDKGSTTGLCTEGTMTMTFTGTYVGLFAENTPAVFRNFSAKVIK